MIELERRLEQSFPAWFKGARERLARPLLRGFSRLSRLDEINAFLERHGHQQGLALVEAALDHLGTRYTVDQVERERIPATGRVLIVANHPSGGLDALALLHLVGSVRGDVRIVANDLLAAIPGLAPLLLPVRILGGKPTPESIAAVEQALEREQCVIVFPAGEVARLGLRGVRDAQWRQGFLRFARATRTPVLPVRIEARNSAVFYGAAALLKSAGTALLPRELFARRGARISLRIGLPRAVEDNVEPANALASIRQALYAIGSRRESTPTGPVPVAPRGGPSPAGGRAGARCRAWAPRPTASASTPAGWAAIRRVLREIGRLREITFRAAGEGTGQRLDLDAYDSWYDHIVLWDPEALEIAGAYRVAPGEAVLAERGLEGFYTASLFRYPCHMLARLAQGMELGRSFVAPAYQGTRSLDYLWLGIGAYLRAHPEVRYLFGPVSISADLPIAAREQLVAYYDRFFGCRRDGVAANRPFRFLAAPPAFSELDADTAYRVLKANLGALGARVPMLYKQYTELCEPGGARFLAFGVDPDFNNAD